MGRVFLDLLRLNRQFAAGIVLLSLVTLFALLSLRVSASFLLSAALVTLALITLI